jgi:hypothetical protein
MTRLSTAGRAHNAHASYAAASPVSLRELLVLKAEELGIYILRGENWEKARPNFQHKKRHR